MSSSPGGVAGIFVGGQASRYGGLPKGLLTTQAGTESLVARLVSIATKLDLDVVLVGAHPAYASLGIPMIHDAPGASGPIAGLSALIDHAGTRPAIALACDMPHVTQELLARLVEAPPAAIVAAKRDGHWEPLFARYDPSLCREPLRRTIDAGRRALKSLLDDVGAQVLDLAPGEGRLLHDWDTPEDRLEDAGPASTVQPRGERAAHPGTRIEEGPVCIADVITDVSHPAAGGIDVFVGLVRDHAEGRTVDTLEYSAYVPMATRELATIAREIEARHAGVRVAARHRIGRLCVGDVAVVCAASAPHREAAFVACREFIEALKQRVPIWKRETGPDGSAWVGWVDVRDAASPREAGEGPRVGPR